MGIAYLDTSAFVPLVIDEPGTSRCLQVWRAAVQLLSTRLLVVETAAALAQAHRLGRLDVDQYERAQSEAASLLAAINIIEVKPQLVENAAQLTRTYPLRGFDAVHLAGASLMRGVTMVSGDARVLDASRGLGLATVNTVP